METPPKSRTRIRSVSKKDQSQRASPPEDLVSAEGSKIVADEVLFEVDAPEDVKMESSTLASTISRLVNEAAAGHYAAAKQMAKRIANHNGLKERLKDTIREMGADLQVVLPYVGIDMYGEFYANPARKFSAGQVLDIEQKASSLSLSSGDDPSRNSLPQNTTAEGKQLALSN